MTSNLGRLNEVPWNVFDVMDLEYNENYEGEESVSQTVRTYFPETWLWDIVLIE